jgi:hypothetical protein
MTEVSPTKGIPLTQFRGSAYMRQGRLFRTIAEVRQ